MILMLSMNWTAIEKSTMRSYRSQCIAQEVRLWCQQGCNILPRKQLQSVSSYSCQETRESPRIKQKPTSIVPCLISLQIRKVNFPDIFCWLIFPNGVRYKQIEVVFVVHLFHCGGPMTSEMSTYFSFLKLILSWIKSD